MITVGLCEPGGDAHCEFTHREWHRADFIVWLRPCLLEAELRVSFYATCQVVHLGAERFPHR